MGMAGDMGIGAFLASLFWIFILTLTAIGHDADSKQKDRVMKICIENGVTYDQCLKAWEGSR